LSSPDPRAVPAVSAVDRALAWFLGVVAQRGQPGQPPISLAQAEHLRDVLAGTSPRRDDTFELLVDFACTMARIDPRVDADALAKLQFHATSLGLGRTQRENREGWWSHAQRNRAFIEDVVRQTQRRRLAVVLGAGHAFDLPLLALAKAFEKLVLVDIDAEALGATVDGVLRDPALRTRVSLRPLDLTGVNGQIVRRIDEAVASSSDAAEARDRLEELCFSYRLAPPRLLPPEEHADLLVSSCVLSQVSWPQRICARSVYERRFGAVPGPLERRWARHFTYLELQLEQDHLTSLAGGDRAGGAHVRRGQPHHRPRRRSCRAPERTPHPHPRRPVAAASHPQAVSDPGASALGVGLLPGHARRQRLAQGRGGRAPHPGAAPGLTSPMTRRPSFDERRPPR
jgi:hypothetical protein